MNPRLIYRDKFHIIINLLISTIMFHYVHSGTDPVVYGFFLIRHGSLTEVKATGSSGTRMDTDFYSAILSTAFYLYSVAIRGHPWPSVPKTLHRYLFLSVAIRA